MRKARWILLFFVLFASVAHATTCGTTTVGGTADGNPNKIVTSAQCTPAANSTITDCHIYTAQAGVNINCALYDSTGKTLLCQGTPVSSSNSSWNVITLSSCPTLVAGTQYYLGNIQSSNDGIAYNSTGGTSYGKSIGTCCTFINLSSPTAGTSVYSIYLNIAAAASTSVKRHKTKMSQ